MPEKYIYVNLLCDIVCLVSFSVLQTFRQSDKSIRVVLISLLANMTILIHWWCAGLLRVRESKNLMSWSKGIARIFTKKKQPLVYYLVFVSDLKSTRHVQKGLLLSNTPIVKKKKEGRGPELCGLSLNTWGDKTHKNGPRTLAVCPFLFLPSPPHQSKQQSKPVVRSPLLIKW